MKNAPIGIFDSGSGGLTVLKALMEQLPAEDFIYFGDTARLPYGNKSGDTIRSYSRENAAFLMEKGIKALVIACNTAAAHAEKVLCDTLPLPVIGVIQPAVNLAVASSKSGRIAVLATKGTLKTGIYQRMIALAMPHAEVVPIPCPLFVPLVEEGMIDHPITRMTVKHYLEPLQAYSVDTVILGCTHYPLLLPLIEEIVGPGSVLIDSASSCACALQETLSSLQLLKEDTAVPGKCTYYASDDLPALMNNVSLYQIDCTFHTQREASIPHISDRFL